MDHAGEGSLQAYLDGELEGTARAGLEQHLSGCASCAAELNALQSVNGRGGAALALLEAPPAPMLRAQAAIAAAARQETAGSAAVPRGSVLRLGSRGFAKAAMLLLALAGAGAAAVPGSPVRRALESTIARVAQWIGADSAPQVVTEDAPVAPAAEPALPVEVNGAGAYPINGQMRVVLNRPAGAVDVVVRMTDERQVRVETEMTQGVVGFRSGGGRLEVTGMGAGRVIVQMPRGLVSGSIEVDGQVYVTVHDDALRGTGPAGAARGDEVSFRIGG